MAELVTLDGMPLSGVTRDGVWTVQTPMEGWFNRPAPKTRSEPRSIGDGGYRTPVEYGSRQITVQGLVSSRNHDYLHQAVERINAVGFRGNVKLLVRGHGATQWAVVDPRPGAQVDTEFLTDQLLRFQIPLEAIDPFKYGESSRFQANMGSALPVFHRGTVPAWPLITVHGGAVTGGYSITLGGRTVTVTATLSAGNVHTVDMRTGVLRMNGSVVRGGLSVANLFSVQPGPAQTITSTVIGSGSAIVRAEVVDTYL